MAIGFASLGSAVAPTLWLTERDKEITMRIRFSTSMVTVTIAAAVISTAISGIAAQTSAQKTLKTP